MGNCNGCGCHEREVALNIDLKVISPLSKQVYIGRQTVAIL